MSFHYVEKASSQQIPCIDIYKW